jgi:hypothetical protein
MRGVQIRLCIGHLKPCIVTLYFVNVQVLFFTHAFDTQQKANMLVRRFQGNLANVSVLLHSCYSAAPTAAAQPINLNIYLPGAAPTTAAAPVAAPTTAQIAAEQVKQSAALRLQLKAQDAQIHKLLADAKPKRAASELSKAKIEAALSSAVSDMASHLRTENPIKLAAQLGVADPVALQEPAQGQVLGVTQAANKLPALSTAAGLAAPGTAAQTAAAKAAHLKKIEEMDGLLLKGKTSQNQLLEKPTKLSKARTQELADGSARAQLAKAVADEERVRDHKKFVQQSLAQARTSQLRGENQVDGQGLDQEESNSFFPSRQEGVRLPEDEASKLKRSYRSKMYELDRAAGSDAEHMKITGSIRDVIPDALFHAMNRQNAIHDLLAPAKKHKGFPARQNSDNVFGHSIAGKFKLPSDRNVIKENDRMLEGLESAAGYQTSARKSSSSGSSDGWGEHYSRRDHDGWNSKRWLGDKTSLQDSGSSNRPMDHNRIPVLSDGWGEQDADQDKASSHQGLAGWKTQLKNSEHALGFKGLMAEQSGFGTRHTELEDAKTASRDGWLR